MKIGIRIESFRKNFEESVKLAASLGVDGIQANATYGELAPENMTEEKIAWAQKILDDNGIVFSAICGDLGHGFMDKEKNPALVEKSKRILDLAKKFGCDIVTTHIGKVPAEENEVKQVMREACRELALYADSIGSCFAVETGPESAVELFDFLESLGAMGVRVNMDPANLVMCVKDDPVKAVDTLKKYIVHTHAKDGIYLEEGGYKEMPLGKGFVDFDKYLPALHEIGFDGYLTIERECGSNPIDDVKLAVDFLREKKAKFGF